MSVGEDQLLAPPPGMSVPGQPTWEVAYLFPPQGAWEESECLALGTNWLIEFSDGKLEVLPPPNTSHQLRVDFLGDLLKTFIRDHRDGRVLFAPLPVRLGVGRYREPDIVYLSGTRVRQSEDYPEGADLVVEVVSEDTANRDLITKRAEYAAAGISEYWIVDPQQETITILVLEETGNEYGVHGTFPRDSQATSRLLDGFYVAVNDVLDAATINND